MEFSSFLTPSNVSFPPPTLPFARSYTLLSSLYVFRPSLFIVTLGRSSVTRHLYIYNPLAVFTFLFLPVLCTFFGFLSRSFILTSRFILQLSHLLLSHGSSFFSQLRPFVILCLFLHCRFFRYLAVSFHFTTVPSFALACLLKRFFFVPLTPLSVYPPRSLLQIFHLSPLRVHRSSFALSLPLSLSLLYHLHYVFRSVSR